MRLLDLGFYSPVITGSRCNVRLSVARQFFHTLTEKTRKKKKRKKEVGEGGRVAEDFNAGRRAAASDWPQQSRCSHRGPMSQRAASDKTAAAAASGGDA